MNDQTISVDQAAEQLGVSVHTVREWCKDFADHLDYGAKPESGTAHRLSPRDVQVLSEISRLSGEKLSAAMINEQLSNMIFAVPITEVSQSAQTAQEAAQMALVALAARLDAVQGTLPPLAARLEDLEHAYRTTWGRLRSMEAERLRIDVVVIAAAAFIAGLVVGLAVWIFQ